MATNLNITNIPAPRVPFIDERTGLMAREWYRFFLNLFVLTGSGNNPVSLEELQLGPPNQPDLTELLIQINQNIAPQYEDQSGDFLATLDTAQLMSMMARFENAEAAIQGAYLQPVVQTGTIANYNLNNSPTAGGVVYGTGPALAVSAAGTLGQVLTSGGAGAPTWATDAGGSVTSVSVVSANGLAGTVATATTTPAITLSTTITGLLKGNGTAISAAASGTDYAPATSGTSILYGNGAGGFSNVTIGTGVAFTGGTLSATGSGGTVTSVAALTLGTTGTDLTSTVANGTTTPVITLQVPTASASNRGALSAADWTTFNSKQDALVSGTNLKTVAGVSLLGAGDVGTIPALYGGTGNTAYTIGDLLYASGASTLSKLSDVATGNALISGGVGVAPAWGKIGLTTHVSGTLAIGNGGTGNTSGTATINANLTGPITSVGNATSVAAQTGTGSTFVMKTAPAITGVATNSSAAAGDIGEFVDSAVTSITINSGSAGNMTSISLTAGDWDVSVTFQNSNIGANSYYSIGISTTSATFAGARNAKQTLYQSVNISISVTSACIPRNRLSLAATTTVYFVAQMGVANNANCDGYMTARRVR